MEATRAADVSTAASHGLKNRQDLIARQPHFRFLDTDYHSLGSSRSCERLHRQRHHRHHHTSFRPPPTFAFRSLVSPSPDARPSSTYPETAADCVFQRLHEGAFASLLTHSSSSILDEHAGTAGRRW